MPSALTFSKRAECYLRLKKPNAAIRDADAALKLNADSAKAFIVRGKAHRLLGQWEAAAVDLVRHALP
jgi:suppressor of tumorigenicity protein 13